MGLASRGLRRRIGAVILVVLFSAAAHAQEFSLAPTSTPPATRSTTHPTTRATTHPVGIGKLSLDELMNLEVTSVSRRPERLVETASAIQVLTNEDIHRSGAMMLPEALRLASNLQVAQVNAHAWAITARGFNGAPGATNGFADKLLVLIDGRTVYSPLFGGVFWDVQNVLLEDVDRIEVISGPGGTLWGANAVNGVINVVSKSAKDTQGVYFTEAAGTFWQNYSAARYGGKIGDDFYYRVYGLGFAQNNTDLTNRTPGNDEWGMTQGGFRADYYPTHENTLTFQGDIYNGEEGDPTLTDLAGGNLLGRFTHVFNEKSDLVVQMYFDNTWRTGSDTGFTDSLRTYDIDMQHRFPLGDRNTILWGLNYRLIRDTFKNTPTAAFFPDDRTLQLFSGFVQDEITIVPERVKLTLGTKLEHNDYSGFELQPSARIAYTPTERQTIWAAVSRAVRSPSRFDDDFAVGLVSPGNFDSEKVLSYELGYRVRPIDRLSLSIAAFYNKYDDLRSFNTDPGAPGTFLFGNDQRADTWGVELSADVQATDWWRLRGGYTFFDKHIWATDATVVPGSGAFESNDPSGQVILQSMMDLPNHFQFDVAGRFVAASEPFGAPSYFSLDVRLAWTYRNVEIAIVGQNLLDDSHPEFGAQEIPRSAYAKVTFRW